MNEGSSLSRRRRGASDEATAEQQFTDSRMTLTPYYRMKLNLFGISGGKDSTRLVGWAIHESGYPIESLVFTFCDTENEYEEVYQQIRDLGAYVKKHGCKPIVWLRAAGDWVEKFKAFPLFLALALWKKRFPSAKARFCTQFLKIKPTEAFIKSLIAEGHEITSHSGVRADESIERSLLEEYGKDMFGCITRRPLLKLKLADVWEGHRKYGLPINPLYIAGWKRVGCRLCIMSNKSDVRRTVRKRPWVIAIYREWEQTVGAFRKASNCITDYSSWFHRKTVPEAQRSRMVMTKKKGEMKVATIDDVARWSLTAHGGKDALLDFMLDEESFDVDDAHHPCQAGFCE